jgi:DNA adenine methylase
MGNPLSSCRASSTARRFSTEWFGWNPGRICNRILRYHDLFRRFRKVEIRHLDFEEALKLVHPEGFAYLDPPYYVQGSVLYKYSMSEDDHVRLARVLRAAPFRWVLSYDDCPRIRELYCWARIGEITMTPTIQTAKGTRRKNQEVLIRNGDW